MTVKSIIKYPNTILNTRCEPVKHFDEEVKTIIKDLLDTMEAHKDKAAGLSAPQIGTAKRICVVRYFFDDNMHAKRSNYQDIVMVDPKIISKSKETELDWEGCLSIPDTYGLVERFEKIKVRALNELGEHIQLKASDYLARVIQHEIDHLDGILFTSKIVGKTLTESEIDKLLEEEER